MKSYAYLHGFASSPASAKARFFAAKFSALGIVLHIPELDAGDFEHLTLSGQLEVVRKAAPPGPLILLGSSLGGYLAALYAERHPEVERVVLMAPAFDFLARWAARMGPAQMQHWKSTGQMPVYHYGHKQERTIHYPLMEDAARYPAYPNVRQPAMVLQGLHDDVVDPQVAHTFCDRQSNATLHLFDSGHDLNNVMEAMWEIAEPFLFHD